MKKLIVLFTLSFIALNSAFAQDRAGGVPIPEATVKVGRISAGNIIATNVTGGDGSSEFNDLPFGKGYYVEVTFSIAGNGMKATSKKIIIENIDITDKPATYTAKTTIPSGIPGSPEKVIIFTVTTKGKIVEKATSGLKDTLKTQV